MPYWNFEYTKAVIYTVVKVGGGTGQDPATEVTHLRLNQPPVFSSVNPNDLVAVTLENKASLSVYSELLQTKKCACLSG